MWEINSQNWVELCFWFMIIITLLDTLVLSRCIRAAVTTALRRMLSGSGVQSQVLGQRWVWTSWINGCQISTLTLASVQQQKHPFRAHLSVHSTHTRRTSACCSTINFITAELYFSDEISRNLSWNLDCLWSSSRFTTVWTAAVAPFVRRVRSAVGKSPHLHFLQLFHPVTLWCHSESLCVLICIQRRPAAVYYSLMQITWGVVSAQIGAFLNMNVLRHIVSSWRCEPRCCLCGRQSSLWTHTLSQTKAFLRRRTNGSEGGDVL